jgi:hypothetical protein
MPGNWRRNEIEGSASSAAFFAAELSYVFLQKTEKNGAFQCSLILFNSVKKFGKQPSSEVIYHCHRIVGS